MSSVPTFPYALCTYAKSTDSEEDGKKWHMKTTYLSKHPQLVGNFSTLSATALAHSNYAKLKRQHSQDHSTGETGQDLRRSFGPTPLARQSALSA